jgi:hypothetical protein
MVADRISLVDIRDALQVVEENNGKISSIMLNRSSHYGTKSVPRFETFKDLKKFIEEMHRYMVPDECSCHTKNEGIYTLLNFTFTKGTNEVFMNNLEKGFQSSKLDQMNNVTFKRLSRLNDLNGKLRQLLMSYTCFPYIEFGYIDCDYIEIIKNEAYYEIIELYKNTRKK